MKFKPFQKGLVIIIFQYLKEILTHSQDEDHLSVAQRGKRGIRVEFKSSNWRKVITGDADGRYGHLKSLPFQADCMWAAHVQKEWILNRWGEKTT